MSSQPPPDRLVRVTPAEARPVPGAPHRRGPGVVLELAFALPILAILAGATWWLLDLPASYPIVVGGLFLGTGVLILRGFEASGPAIPFGGANRVTLWRSTAVLCLAGAIPYSPPILPSVSWWMILLGAGSMLLDNLDGRLARRSNTVSRFGARFDMEVDALLILVLSLLVWEGGRMGPWVILIGALRYLFVGAGWMWPILRAPLPESRRRQTVCVLQGVALLVCLAPSAPAQLAVALAVGALGTLVYSFSVDVAWLLARGRPASAPP